MVSILGLSYDAYDLKINTSTIDYIVSLLLGSIECRLQGGLDRSWCYFVSSTVENSRMFIFCAVSESPSAET